MMIRRLPCLVEYFVYVSHFWLTLMILLDCIFERHSAQSANMAMIKREKICRKKIKLNQLVFFRFFFLTNYSTSFYKNSANILGWVDLV